MKGLHEQLGGVYSKEPLLRTPSEKKRALNAMVVSVGSDIVLNKEKSGMIDFTTDA